jgi:hypothetical protein
MKNLKLFIFQILLLASTVTLVLTGNHLWAFLMFMTMVVVEEKK